MRPAAHSLGRPLHATPGRHAPGRQSFELTGAGPPAGTGHRGQSPRALDRKFVSTLVCSWARRDDRSLVRLCVDGSVVMVDHWFYRMFIGSSCHPPRNPPTPGPTPGRRAASPSIAPTTSGPPPPTPASAASSGHARSGPSGEPPTTMKPWVRQAVGGRFLVRSGSPPRLGLRVRPWPRLRMQSTIRGLDP